MQKMGQKKVFFILKLRIKTRFINAGSSFYVLKPGVRKAALPKQRHRLLQNFIFGKVFWSTHVSTYRIEPDSSIFFMEYGDSRRVGSKKGQVHFQRYVYALRLPEIGPLMASYPWARTASNFLMDRSGCSCTQPHATTRWIFRRLRARGADFRFPGLDEQDPRHTNVIHVRNSYRSPHPRAPPHPPQPLHPRPNQQRPLRP